MDITKSIGLLFIATKIDCRNLTIDHAKVCYSGDGKHPTATVSCDAGFVNRYFGTLRCSGNSWPTQIQECIIQDCGTIQIANGLVHGNNYTYNASLIIYCYPNYHLVGPSKIICTADGTWSDTPQCTAYDPCVPNPCQNNGTCNKSGSSYDCSCLAGFTGISCTTALNTTSITSTIEASTSSSPVLTAEATGSSSTVPTTERSTITSAVSLTETTASTTSQPSLAFSSGNPTSLESGESSFPAPTATAKRHGDKTTVVVSVTVPIVVVVVCAVIVGICLIRRWKRKKGLDTTALERAPGIAISNTSYGDHQVTIPKAASVQVPDGTSNEYAEIVANGNPVNEQADGYYTINDVPKISQTNNTNYAHVNTHKAVMLDTNYSHIENNNTKVSKTGDYGFSMFKRGIFQLKKSFKKDSNSSYDNLEMKTVANSPNKTVKGVSMTEIEFEYNHTQSGVHGTIKKDIQNEKDEYSHLNYKPKLMKEDANEVANENPYRRKQSKLSSESLANVRPKEYENAVGTRHDYFVLEAVGESADDSIEESDITKFEERNSNSASGFQYDYAREVERSGTHKNEETRDIQSACPYELSKDIDNNSDIANKPDGDSFGTSSATDDENQNHHYFILSKT